MFIEISLRAISSYVMTEWARYPTLNMRRDSYLTGLGNDPKTGTPIYMAVEVQDAGYLFMNRRAWRNLASIPFLHNYLHDVESLFWIGFHALFSTVPAKYSKAELALRLDQRILFNAFFPHRLEGSTQRSNFFVFNRRKDDAMKALPTEFESVVEALFSIQDLLVEYYMDVENLKGFPQQEQFKQIYCTEALAGLLAYFEAAAKKHTVVIHSHCSPTNPLSLLVLHEVPVYREDH
ncbi:hypothetical protein EDD18DRAFT_285378 [Armillaria luteobubalina]|uniref:Fungal-type protein kinase domain-containing protein n=1 Tax=Armillaria luteobubalina TaxID=153913 RepID=A0AA39Q416_9AGAR|nr:hypothetical protein EDD18DRAFT_285378 [Armillaria luteobubalina]